VTPPELEPLEPPDVEPEELPEEPPELLPELLPDVPPEVLPEELLPDVLPEAVPEELLDELLGEPVVTATTHSSRSDASMVLVVKYRILMVPPDETNRLIGEGTGRVARVQAQSPANALSATYTHAFLAKSNASNSHRM
jgi:hypothetical protein